MNQNTIAKISNILLFMSAVCFLTFYLACERDFSPFKIIAPPDTTSHNFTWQIDTFGVISSYLLDVAIISENDIWSVGEIYLKDSTGAVDNEPYGAIHWNGNKWTLMKVPYHDFGSTNLYPGPLRTVFAFNSSEVYATSSANLLKWNGSSWDEKAFFMTGIPFDGQVRKMWGSSPSSIFCVGNSGAIYHYNGSSWQKLESGTTVDLQDVWGSPHGSVVWACGYTDFVGTMLLKITGTTVETVYEDNDNLFNIRPNSISGVLTGLWTNDPSKLYIITPAGMYIASANTNGEAQRIWTENNFLPCFPRALRGESGNDLFTTGDFSFMAHYNGASWHIYNNFAGRIRSRGIAITRNLIILAGLDIQSNRATIIRGER